MLTDRVDRRKARVDQFDITMAIDFVAAAENLGVHKVIFDALLCRFEPIVIEPYSKHVADNVVGQKWRTVKWAVKHMKSKSRFVGAGRIHYICY